MTTSEPPTNLETAVRSLREAEESLLPPATIPRDRRTDQQVAYWKLVEQARAYALVSIAESQDRIARAQEMRTAIAMHYLDSEERDADDLLEQYFRPIVDTNPL